MELNGIAWNLVDGVIGDVVVIVVVVAVAIAVCLFVFSCVSFAIDFGIYSPLIMIWYWFF